VGWRSIFLINVPVAAGAGYLAWKYVEEHKDAQRAAPLDTLGAVLATVALGLLTWALTHASEPGARAATTSTTAVAGFALLAGFVWHERGLADRAILPLAMFASTTFVALNLVTFFLYGSLGGLLVLLPFLLIGIEHWSAVAAGAALLPLPLVIGFGSRLMGRVAARSGARLPLTVGSTLVACGLALYALIGTTGIRYWIDIFPPTLLTALGMGACVAPLTSSVIASVAADRVGVASGFNNAVARIAGLIATAALGFVFSRQQSAASFVIGFRVATLVAAACAMAAATVAVLMIKPKALND
jgi:hypothetical protein